MSEKTLPLPFPTLCDRNKEYLAYPQGITASELVRFFEYDFLPAVLEHAELKLHLSDWGMLLGSMLLWKDMRQRQQLRIVQLLTDATYFCPSFVVGNLRTFYRHAYKQVGPRFAGQVRSIVRRSMPAHEVTLILA